MRAPPSRWKLTLRPPLDCLPPSSSIVRPFRFAGTVTAAQGVGSVLAVGGEQAAARETADYQREPEGKKKGKVRLMRFRVEGRLCFVCGGLYCVESVVMVRALVANCQLEQESQGGVISAQKLRRLRSPDSVVPTISPAWLPCSPAPPPQAATDRAAALRRQVATLHHRAKELEQVIGVLFQGVFAHRFRRVPGGCLGVAPA